MKKILLLGTSGFIGKNLKEQLETKYNLFSPSRTTLDILDLDQLENFLAKEQFDIIINSANTNNTRNITTSDYDILDKNLRMFFNLFKCNNLYGKMYYFGSGAEYDMTHYIPNMCEEYFGTYIPKDPYGFSKYIMSQICEKNNNIYDLRLFGVYGKYEEWERRFISNAICRVLTGKDITIEKNVYFDYIWIDDLSNIIQWFIENEPKYKHYNVCTGRKIDLLSLAYIVRESLNIDCKITIKEPGWKKEYTGNNKRLLNEIGDFQFTNFEESIKRLCQYYQENIQLINGQIFE